MSNSFSQHWDACCCHIVTWSLEISLARSVGGGWRGWSSGDELSARRRSSWASLFWFTLSRRQGRCALDRLRASECDSKGGAGLFWKTTTGCRLNAQEKSWACGLSDSWPQYVTDDSPRCASTPPNSPTLPFKLLFFTFLSFTWPEAEHKHDAEGWSSKSFCHSLLIFVLFSCFYILGLLLFLYIALTCMG